MTTTRPYTITAGHTPGRIHFIADLALGDTVRVLDGRHVGATGPITNIYRSWAEGPWMAVVGLPNGAGVIARIDAVEHHAA